MLERPMLLLLNSLSHCFHESSFPVPTSLSPSISPPLRAPFDILRHGWRKTRKLMGSFAILYKFSGVAECRIALGIRVAWIFLIKRRIEL